MNKFFSIDNFKKNWYWYIICFFVTLISINFFMSFFDLMIYEFYGVPLDVYYHNTVVEAHAGFSAMLYFICCIWFYRLGRFIFCKYLFEDKKTIENR